MAGAIILTAVICFLAAALLNAYADGRRATLKVQGLEKKCAQSAERVRALEAEIRKRDNEAAYKQGLYEGRETDALYRRFVSQYSAGDQASAILYGENADRRDSA